MKNLVEKSDFLKYLSYRNEPRWFNYFIHIGFGVALLLALASVIFTFL